MLAAEMKPEAGLRDLRSAVAAALSPGAMVAIPARGAKLMPVVCPCEPPPCLSHPAVAGITAAAGSSAVYPARMREFIIPAKKKTTAAFKILPPDAEQSTWTDHIRSPDRRPPPRVDGIVTTSPAAALLRRPSACRYTA